ncbi:MAG: hypothetical protein WDN06_22290 [Asticcacaulis sp.]
MQRYDSSGAKLGVETQVDVGSTHSDTRADVAVLSDDSYVVVWQDVPDSGVEIQRFDESGAQDRQPDQGERSARRRESQGGGAGRRRLRRDVVGFLDR